MAVSQLNPESYTLDLQFRGTIRGLTFRSQQPGSSPQCHFFGGIPYALPPVGSFRWQRPRPLPPCYRYGTAANPGQFTGGCGICPQPSAFGGTQDKSLWDEDCLQLNIWIPIGEKPKDGWPVLFWVHGGFLQFGTPNETNVNALLSETEFKAIIVSPAYRLNALGFLATSQIPEICPNVGFWDLRLALEWTWQNISYFGGNPGNITAGGYSAGSHATFHQLAYDLGLPEEKSIIKRALMLSNGPGMQPRTLKEAQVQFEELLKKLSIPLNLPAKAKLERLQALDAKIIIQATKSIKYHQFRGVTDSSFVRSTLFEEISSGSFATVMKRRNMKLIIGECSDEHFVYGTWRPPKESFGSLFERLQADYSEAACEALMKHYYPNKKLPGGVKTWKEAFGKIYADMQIHHLQRAFVYHITRHGAGDLVYRYRVEWRAKCSDARWPRSWGATHQSDKAIWFWGDGGTLTEAEKEIAKTSFVDNFAKFVRGEALDWRVADPLQVRTLKVNGEVVNEKDKGLDEAVRVWELLRKAGATGKPSIAKL